MVNGSLRGAKERRSFKPKVAGSTPVGRISCCSSESRALPAPEEDAGRVVPVPATLAWLLEARINLNGADCDLLFPTPRGRLWRERTFYRDGWKPTQEAAGLDIRPHECRHSYVIHLRGADVNDADLAEVVGHRVETILARYTPPTGRDLSVTCAAIG